jgi:hypothetical protein
MTIGPIENALHPGVGYGTEACGRALDAAVSLGATWVAFTPFARMWSTRSTAIDLTFELPFELNRRAVARAIEQAHARGLRVMLVPHLWVETGGWRGELEPLAPPDEKDAAGEIVRGRGAEADFRRLAASYRRFLLAWADLAEATDVEMLSIGVELRSWATSGRAIDALRAIIADTRARYRGILTYSGNWDDVDQTIILGDLDAIGVNAFYPLADKDGAALPALLDGGGRVAREVAALAERWQRPVLFTEVGYTARPDPAIRPWEWPDTMHDVVVDEAAQAEAYLALLAPVIDEPRFSGFFVWRQFADPDDVSQEAAWGFPVVGKRAELVVRDAYASRFAVEPMAPAWGMLGLGARGEPGFSWRFPGTRVAEGTRTLYGALR